MLYAYAIYKLEADVFILLSDGAGLTSRQCATVLSQAGHRVEALSPDPHCLCRYTRHVRAVHRVPAFGTDPLAWLDAALEVAVRRGADVLLPVQEQVTVMSLARDRIEAEGVHTAVPDFAALAQVQDKFAAFRTLTRLGLPQPPTAIVSGWQDVAGLPVFVKARVGTASAGVRRVTTPAGLRAAVVPGTEVLVQRPADGPLIMMQSVFAKGEMVAFHTCQRVREGVGGGASHKRAVDLPEVRDHVAALGAALDWHGGLSADVILTADGPRFIDINPRLVEPVNAMLSGVDLAGALVATAVSHPGVQPPGEAGTQTHQLLLAILGAAQHGGRRRDVLRELRAAVTRTGSYRHSREELTRAGWRDPVAGAPVALALATTLVSPGLWRRFTGGATSAYALTPEGWDSLLAAARARALLVERGSVGGYVDGVLP